MIDIGLLHWLLIDCSDLQMRGAISIEILYTPEECYSVGKNKADYIVAQNKANLGRYA